MLINGVISLLSYGASDTIPAEYAAYATNLTALGTLLSGRVYQDELPRGYTLPAVAVHQYGGSRDYDMAGPVDVRERQIQLDCYGRTSAECSQVANLIESILTPFAAVLPDGSDVRLCKLERSQGMPFMARADVKGVANRWLLGYIFTTQE